MKILNIIKTPKNKIDPKMSKEKYYGGKLTFQAQ
jgi:hypothetical protein